MKKLLLPIVAILLVGFTIFVSALGGIMTGGNDSPYLVEVDVVKGWNIIAGILPNEAITADSQIKVSDIKAVWYYAPNLKKYVQIHPNLDMSAQIDDDVALTSSMWVYSNKVGRLKYSTLEDYMPLSMRTLSSGYNFFTITPDIEGLTFEDIEGGCNIEKIFGWDSSVQNWVVFPLDEDFHKDTMGFGLIVKVSSDCTLNKLSDSNVVSPPPIIPSCQDSDGGLNYNVQGEANDGVEDLEDFCVNNIKLSEALCNNDGNAAYAQYDCPNRCSNGVCI